MGYGYNFMIALEELDKLEKEPNFEKEILPTMKREFRALYRELIKEGDWFPEFGSADTSGSGGYGVGDSGDHPLPDLFRFTSQFPELTFVIFFTYWDHTNLNVYRIRGNQLLQRWEKSYEEVPFGKIKATFQLEDLSIDNDITDYFEGISRYLLM